MGRRIFWTTIGKRGPKCFTSSSYNKYFPFTENLSKIIVFLYCLIYMIESPFRSVNHHVIFCIFHVFLYLYLTRLWISFRSENCWISFIGDGLHFRYEINSSSAESGLCSRKVYQVFFILVNFYCLLWISYYLFQGSLLLPFGLHLIPNSHKWMR